MENRCKQCNRLLFVETDGIKQIRVDNIEYKINGTIQIVCKCKQLNKF